MSRFVSGPLYLVPAFAFFYMAACGGGNPSVTQKTLSSIAVTAASSSIGVGATDQFTATGTYSDNSSQQLTGVTWASSSTATATISTAGVATAIAVGTTKITARSGTVTSPPFSLKVTSPTVQSIVIYANSPPIKVGGMDQFLLFVYYSDGSETEPPPTSVTWASSSTGVATIDSAGVATGLSPGTTSITASSGSVTSPPVALTVPSITSIAILPNPATLIPGQTQQFIATGTYSDSSFGDITSCATWTSSDTATATISSTGLVTGISVGTTDITATSGSIKSPPSLLTVSTTMPPPPSELLYAAANNAILGFAVDPASGLLSAPTYTPGPSLPCGGDASPYQGIVSLPKLGLLYVSDGQNNQVGGSFYGRVFNNQVDGFAVSKTTGTLTPLLGSPFPLPLPTGYPNGYPQGMTTDPQGKFLYVSDPADIDALTINSTTGALTFISNAASSGGPDVTVDPSGTFLFADGTSSFAIDANTGTLTEVAGSPFSLPNYIGFSPSPSTMVVDSTGNFLYVLDSNFPTLGPPSPFGLVAGYSINATSGALTQIPDPPSLGSALPSGIATVGSFLYVTNAQGIYGFSIASGTGVLTQVSGSPFLAATTAGGLTATSDGKFLFEAGSDQIYVFTIDPTTGALSANGNPVPAAGGPFLLNLYTP